MFLERNQNVNRNPTEMIGCNSKSLLASKAMEKSFKIINILIFSLLTPKHVYAKIICSTYDLIPLFKNIKSLHLNNIKIPNGFTENHCHIHS